jgi:predicted DNA-binding transcriptional regulator AlpA
VLHSDNEPAAAVAASSAVAEVPATVSTTPPTSTCAPPLKPSRGQSNHTRPQVPPAGIMDIPDALLRLCHVLALVGVSDNTLATRIKANIFPEPDMHSGINPLWRVSTIRTWLNGSVAQQLENRLADVQQQMRDAPAHRLAELQRDHRRLLDQLRRIRRSKPAPSTV